MENQTLIPILAAIVGFLMGVISTQFTIMRKFEKIVSDVSVNSESIKTLKGEQGKMDKEMNRNTTECRSLHNETLGVIKQSLAQNNQLIGQLAKNG